MSENLRLQVPVKNLEPSSVACGRRRRVSGRRGDSGSCVVFLAAAVAALGCLPFAGSAQAAAPVQCKGVPPGYYTSGMEAQHWWETGWNGIYPRRDGAFWKDLTYDRAQAHGHIHVNVSMPLCQTVGSEVGRPTATFRVAVSMHEVQSGDTINDVRAKVYSGSSAHQTNVGLNNFANQHCTSFDANGHRDCTKTYSLSVNYTKVPVDGWQGFRIRAYGADSNGFDREAIQWIPLNIQNGHPASNFSSSTYKYLRGTGWYTDSGYLNVSFSSPYPVAPVTGPVSWRVRYWATTERCSNGKRCADEPTQLFASIDPRFHAEPINYGRVLLNRSCAGQTGCNTTSGVTKTISFDPRRAGLNLCNGAHNLTLRGAGNTDLPRREARNVGVEKIPFTTKVPGQPAC